jgi:hypothetical protein
MDAILKRFAGIRQRPIWERWIVLTSPTIATVENLFGACDYIGQNWIKSTQDIDDLLAKISH